MKVAPLCSTIRLRTEYDDAGNLLSASQPNASVNLAYDPRNRLTSITRPNGVSSQYAYDAAANLLSIDHSGGQGIQIPLGYSYDAAINRTSYSTGFAQPQGRSNTFDNRLIGSSGTSYSYDDNGNLVSSTDSTGTTTYTWDSRDRLISVSVPSGQKTTFLYDFVRNLIQQSDAGPTLNLTQNFVLDDLTNVAYIARSNGESVSVLAGRTMDQDFAAIHANGQVEYGLVDAVNSTIATADHNGKLASSFSYEPFGKTTATSTYPFQFTGRVPATAGLYYYRARYYCPSVGRFISEDPIGFGGGSTLLYEYAANNPLNRTDPNGKYDPSDNFPGLSCQESCETYANIGIFGCVLLGASVGALTVGIGGAIAGGLCALGINELKTIRCKRDCSPPPACLPPLPPLPPSR